MCMDKGDLGGLWDPLWDLESFLLLPRSNEYLGPLGLPREVQCRGLQGKQEVATAAPSARHRPPSGAPCAARGGVCQGGPEAGRAGGGPAARVVVPRLAGQPPLSLSLSLSGLLRSLLLRLNCRAERAQLCSSWPCCSAPLTPPPGQRELLQGHQARPGGGQGLGQSVHMERKSPKWKVLLTGESPGTAPRRATGGRGAWVLGCWPDFQDRRRTWGGSRVLACAVVRGACPGCRGTSEHVWSMSGSPGARVVAPVRAQGPGASAGIRRGAAGP